MALAHRWASRNLTRLELVSSLLLLVVLVGTFLGRGLRLFAAVEERSLQATVLNLNSALRIHFYELVIAGRAADAVAWQGANPVRVLEESVETQGPAAVIEYPELAQFHASAAGLGARYRGEFDFIDPESIVGGQWYFDRGESMLVYRVRNGEFFQSALAGTPRLRFRLDVQYNPGEELPVDVTIRSVDKYQWIEAGVNP